MTNPMGQSFLSYRSSNRKEARLLILAQREHGIPTWHDVEDLEDGRTEDKIRQALESSNTANGVLLITPAVESSPMIRTVEARLLVRRAKAGDGFFLVPVAAGGLDRDAASDLFSQTLGLEQLRWWNLQLVPEPLGAQNAAAIARRVVDQRLAEIHRALPSSEPLRVGLFVQRRSPSDASMGLVIDWCHRSSNRLVSQEAWDQRLLPALAFMAEAVGRRCPGRKLVAEGPCTLSAALALGRAFVAPAGIPLGWRQLGPGGENELWHLGNTPRDSGFRVQLRSGDLQGRDLAVLVSVVDEVEWAVVKSKDRPNFRAVLEISKPGEYPHLLEAGDAVDLARKVAAGIRRARREYSDVRRTHLFLAGPAGLAMLIGQLLNTVGPVQTYEQVESDLSGRYLPSALLGGPGPGAPARSAGPVES